MSIGRTFLFFLSLWSLQVSALVVTDNVATVGCHMDKDLCFFYFESAVISVPGCGTSNSVRFGATDNAQGVHNSERIYSTLMAAQMAHKKVQVSIPENTCFQGYPTISWIQMQPE
ncbi:MAG: hypothetical protein COB58_09290 [Thalassobium sp.]|nr:MAG: hypothetical protein COB58_14470 [Thalassobium sp.]PHQ85474.1 MAG: hypothetical protein COB58_09290 [Thalassobium sp.]